MEQEWYQAIQKRYMHLCKGELIESEEEIKSSMKKTGMDKDETEEDPIEEESGEDDDDQHDEPPDAD